MIRSLAVAAVTAALVAAVVASGLASAATLPAAAHPSGSSGAQGIKGMPALETQVLEGVNDLRRSQGLVALRPSVELAEAAREHSLSMAENGFFDHTSPNGMPFSKRLGAKYPSQGSRFWRVGENMVWGAPALSARLALDMWLKSPEHRAILLAPAWRQIGLGAVHALAAPGIYAGSSVTILTADFGVRR